MEATREAIGQEALANRLAERADAGTLAHAMLFTGSPGRGGLALALGLARRLHCADILCHVYIRNGPFVQKQRMTTKLEVARVSLTISSRILLGRNWLSHK